MLQLMCGKELEHNIFQKSTFPKILGKKSQQYKGMVGEAGLEPATKAL